ncbi:hypothetical protein HUS70_07145 [Pandoraea nosoerga]|uniref:Uncharacterized protein n=1 Tax=Pandoraea nosoerga TaxID=2508296 RepID=A0A5E4TL96_9BURK|nr:hypothetical protein [Pandoraea nosoerga]MBN4665487.1 hypothetical protein [Pandoraea nosoerga]MBN4675012.1 hypothetical protein [Pandoraea nosoerga]MBN4680328.1 hypothetical protein [Pandoraea nosoerga]MBN4744439.1 hypothetical protein [Pandoraea nosoerga]VVD87334.1 hypothetical protein PNO31109_01415 [Pandoraea nosoerga]
MALDLMSGMRHVRVVALGLSGVALSAFVHAQTPSATAPAEPVDASGRACGAIRALPADVTHYRYEVTNLCARQITFSWRCNSTQAEQSLDVAGKGTQLATCVKASGAAGEIVFRFGPPGTGD